MSAPSACARQRLRHRRGRPLQQAEGEGFDVATMDLPAGQDTADRRSRRLNPRTIVVLNTSNPVPRRTGRRDPALDRAGMAARKVATHSPPALLRRPDPQGKLPVRCPSATKATADLARRKPQVGSTTWKSILDHRYYDTKGRARLPLRLRPRLHHVPNTTNMGAPAHGPAGKSSNFGVVVDVSMLLQARPRRSRVDDSYIEASRRSTLRSTSSRKTPCRSAATARPSGFYAQTARHSPTGTPQRKRGPPTPANTKSPIRLLLPHPPEESNQHPRLLPAAEASICIANAPVRRDNQRTPSLHCGRRYAAPSRGLYYLYMPDFKVAILIDGGFTMLHGKKPEKKYDPGFHRGVCATCAKPQMSRSSASSITVRAITADGTVRKLRYRALPTQLTTRGCMPCPTRSCSPSGRVTSTEGFKPKKTPVAPANHRR